MISLLAARGGSLDKGIELLAINIMNESKLCNS